MAWTAWPEQGPVRVQGFGPEQLESWSCRPRASRGSWQADPGLDVAPRKSCPGVSLWWRSLGEEAGPRPRAVLAPGGRLPCRSGEPRGGNPPLGEQSREGKGEPACRSPDVLGARTARPPGPLTRVCRCLAESAASSPPGPSSRFSWDDRAPEAARPHSSAPPLSAPLWTAVLGFLTARSPHRWLRVVLTRTSVHL